MALDSGDWGVLAVSQGDSLWDGSFRGGSGDTSCSHLRGSCGEMGATSCHR